MKAVLKNYRQSPRKVRLVVDSIRGKTVNEAINILSFLPKRAATPMQKLVSSALANAKQKEGTDTDSLVIKEMTVDEGTTLKRMMPRARGSAYVIRKRSSHISLSLGENLKKAKVKTKAIEK